MKQRLAARAGQGFTLVELAIVTAIVGLLLGSLMYTLTAQTEQRGIDTTRRSLDSAREMLLSYAVVNGRLPCPASATSNGDESPVGGGSCTDYYTGFLPAKAIGFQPTDSNGYALDAWNNRIRYAVSRTVPVNSSTPRICRSVAAGTAPVTPHFTHRDNLRQNGIDCAPSDLVVCASATGIQTSPASCNTAPSVTNQSTLVAVVWSQGRNFAGVTTGGTDEVPNNKHRLPSVLNDHAVFVSHPPSPSDGAGGEFDDMLVWIPVGVLYDRLIAAGALP